VRAATAASQFPPPQPGLSPGSRPGLFREDVFFFEFITDTKPFDFCKGGTKNMILEIFTIAHVLISLVGIFSGFVVAYGLINGKQFAGWTSLFLWTTVLTSVTGFMFPFHGFQPSYVVGAISLLILAAAIFARRHLATGWRKTFAIASVLALYLNVFVLVVQLFRRVPALKGLAPTQTEPAFKLTQLVVLVAFTVLGVLATTRFRRAQLLNA
jgi:hypothetical protein